MTNTRAETQRKPQLQGDETKTLPKEPRTPTQLEKTKTRSGKKRGMVTARTDQSPMRSEARREMKRSVDALNLEWPKIYGYPYDEQ